MQQYTRYVKGETVTQALDEFKCSNQDGRECALAVSRSTQTSVRVGGQVMAGVLQVSL